MLIIHGSEDGVVHPWQSEHFYSLMREAGNDVTLIIVPGAGHYGAELNRVVRREAADFLDLKLAR